MNFLKKKILVLYLMLLTILSGCGLLSIGIENMNDAIFSNPKVVKNKITNPVRDDVKLSAFGLDTPLFCFRWKIKFYFWILYLRMQSV